MSEEGWEFLGRPCEGDMTYRLNWMIPDREGRFAAYFWRSMQAVV